MAEVLGLVGFVPRETSGDQVRGPCREQKQGRDLY